MECLDTTKHLKINLNKNINTVVIVVEGEKDEFELLKRIFSDILGYVYVEKKRNGIEIEEYKEFVRKGNFNSKIIVFNTSSSNINSIEDDSYRNDIFKILYEKYNVDIKNVPMYFIWDRDRESNDYKKTKNLISRMGMLMKILIMKMVFYY